MLLNYHKILGVAPGASKREIKKAYYRMVKMYHPDRNTSKEAHEMFILIHEAYDALLAGRTSRIEPAGVKRRKPEDIKGTPQYYEKQYRQRYKERVKRRGRREPSDGDFITNPSMRIFFSWVPLIPLLLTGCIFIDGLLPRKITEEVIRNKEVMMNSIPEVQIRTDLHEFGIPYRDHLAFKAGDTVRVKASRIFDIVVRVDSKEQTTWKEHNVTNIFGGMIVIPIALFFFSALAIYAAINHQLNELLLVVITLLTLLVGGLLTYN